MHQAWPKFAASLLMKTQEEGIAVVAYAPCTASFQSGAVDVQLRVETEYPFRDRIKILVTCSEPVDFPLQLRIPKWATRAQIEVGGEVFLPSAESYYPLTREWSGTTEVILTLPMQARSSRRYRGALAIERGPLVYSLKMGEEWTRINHDLPCREEPHADYEVRPTTPWQYALQFDEARPEASIQFEEHALGALPFSPEGAPVSARVQGKRIRWNLQHGWAGNTPKSPVETARIESDQVEDLTLIPYGCTNLRVTEFPTL
ncbi:MAG: glycoside hydrolase family 127 protein [Coraliomargarita sp.]|nr:glycoside hydrolase family 127 protein [Coraliomargarita sp.]